MLERLKKARKDLGYTQAEFAKKLGMSLTGYNLIEKGKRELSSRHIKAICSIFGISEEWLKGLAGFDEFDNQGLTNEILKLASQLSEENQEYLLTLAKAMYNKQVDEYNPEEE